jgi:hypothetical protein
MVGHKSKVSLLRASVGPTSNDVPCFVSFDVTEPCSAVTSATLYEAAKCYEPRNDSIQGCSVKINRGGDQF